MRQILRLWHPIARAIDALADTVGSAHLYPIDPSGVAVDKLAYVHTLVTACRQRLRPVPNNARTTVPIP